MTVESEIYDRLTEVSGLTDLVSTRISQGLRLQDEANPGVSFFFTSRLPFPAMSATAAIRQARMQVDSYADDLTGAQAVAKQVAAALDRHKDATGIADIRLIAERDLTELEDLDELQYRITQEYMVDYTEV